MELGAMVCRPKNPDCETCPLSGLCLANRHNTTAVYPKRDAARKVPHRHLAIAIIRKKGNMLAVQRQMEGFLGGLWEFPAVTADGLSSGTDGLEALIAARTGLKVTVDRRLTRIRHAYTHFTITGDVYLCQYAAGRVRMQNARGHRWVTLRSLARLPLHKAIHKILDALAETLV